MSKARDKDPGGVKFTLVQKIKQLEEQLAQALEERRGALAQAQDYLKKLKTTKNHVNSLIAGTGDLRKQLEDMRRQRDMAQAEEECEREKRIVAQKNLYRAMGWVDAKLDRPPLMEDLGEIPF